MSNQKYYNRTLKYSARALRNNATKYEKILWEVIRKKQVQNIQFYRQVSIGTFIIDFYARKIKLAIEVDGEYHLTKEAQLKDFNRDLYLNNLGIHILRFSNKEIISELSKALSIIKDTVINRLKNPPSFSKEGGGKAAGWMDNLLSN